MIEAGERIAGGREADILALADGRVLRHFLREGAEDDAVREVAAMQAAGKCLRVPRAFEVVTHEGRAGIVMERLEGIDLLTELEKKPWRAMAMGRILGELHLAMTACEAPGSLPAVKERIRRRVGRTPEIPAWLAALCGQVLDGLPDGDRIGHGDFHPGNIVRTPDGPAVIDWANAARGDPLADVARTRMMLALGELPEETPLPLRLAARGVRKLVFRSYSRTVRRGLRIDAEQLRRWELVKAIERIGEGIPGEQGRLARYIRERIPLEAEPGDRKEPGGTVAT